MESIGTEKAAFALGSPDGVSIEDKCNHDNQRVDDSGKGFVFPSVVESTGNLRRSNTVSIGRNALVIQVLLISIGYTERMHIHMTFYFPTRGVTLVLSMHASCTGWIVQDKHRARTSPCRDPASGRNLYSKAETPSIKYKLNHKDSFLLVPWGGPTSSREKRF